MSDEPYVQLPLIDTLIQPIPFNYPGSIVNPKELMLVSSARDNNIELRKEIDCDKLTKKKSGKNVETSSYPIALLRSFAKRAGLPTSGNKEHLVEILRAEFCE